MEPVILRPFTVNDLPILKNGTLSDYILKRFEHPESWLGETENKNGNLIFIHHFIVMYGGIPIGFCQYYDCYFAQEEWYEITSPGVTFQYRLPDWRTGLLSDGPWQSDHRGSLAGWFSRMRMSRNHRTT